jgi:hypothetical protein
MEICAVLGQIYVHEAHQKFELPLTIFAARKTDKKDEQAKKKSDRCGPCRGAPAHGL